MPAIVLTTLNARYAHCSFGLRYLHANLPADLRAESTILEFDLRTPVGRVVSDILAHNPKIVGIGVYVWNTLQARAVVEAIRAADPGVTIVLGGPEVSYETDDQPIVVAADFVVCGEADHAFGELCRRLLTGRRPLQKIIRPELPRFDGDHPIALPYTLYNDQDLQNRVVYVEASRGCPFSCEFCLSSLDIPVRTVPLEPFLDQMQRLLDRGLRSFKFVDRTFNLSLNTSRAILQFFLDRYTPGLFVHFEMVPDRLGDSLRSVIERFPPGALQFEVGVQTFNPLAAELIQRKQDYSKLEDNLRWLRSSTGVHVHADLIAGLPGEDLASFAAGFDRLWSLGPQEIQVGLLKRLRGTPISRHDEPWGMVYSPKPPYTIQETRLIDRPTMVRLAAFGQVWDRVGNSGHFVNTLQTMLEGVSPFAAVMGLTDRILKIVGRTHSIPLNDLTGLVMGHLVEERGMEARTVAGLIWSDHVRCGRPDRPACLKGLIDDDLALIHRRKTVSGKRSRQDRHLPDTPANRP